MKPRSLIAGLSAVLIAAVIPPEIPWAPGDRDRPLPPKITADPGALPSDAVVLFDGQSLAAWQHGDGKPPAWKVRDGYFEVAPGSGDLVTAQAFGDCQLHVEWATPSPTQGTDQEPGNSGVYLMSLYEIQVLDSFRNQTYADGQAAAVYDQYPPLVNASRAPGEWQSYDIVFHGPRFGAAGELLRLATVTLLHNGVLVQDHVRLTGPTDFMHRPPYRPHPEKMPLLLQDHGQPVRFRNIWIRELN
jgi:3-keto-disaccharide hydrolase